MIRDKSVIAIILAGGRNLGRCSRESQLPAALWPVGEEAVLQRLLEHLARQGVTEAALFSNGDDLLRQKLSHLNSNYNLKLKFLDEPLPMGTAGCIRKAAEDEDGRLFIIFSAAVVSPPDIDFLLQAHNKGQSHLTVFFNPSQNGNLRIGNPADIYVCDRALSSMYLPMDTLISNKDLFLLWLASVKWFKQLLFQKMLEIFKIGGDIYLLSVISCSRQQTQQEA